MSNKLPTIEAIDDKIIFEFLEDIQNKTFSKVSEGGIILQQAAENQLQEPRFVKVLKVGPDVKDVKVEDIVLVEPLKWTTAIEIEEADSKFWITDEKSVLAISE